MDICCGEAVALINYADHHGTPGSTAHCVAIKTLLLALLLQSSVASAQYPDPGKLQLYRLCINWLILSTRKSYTQIHR